MDTILTSILQVGGLKLRNTWYHIQIQVGSDGSRIHSQVGLTPEPASLLTDPSSSWALPSHVSLDKGI